MASGAQSFIRRALVEPEPPPVASTDVLMSTRARLFDGAFNTMLTLLSALIIVALAWPTLKFLFIDAVWAGSSRLDCLPETVGREVGAFWPFVKAKFGQFVYGFYPENERWRVDLTYVLFFATYMLPFFLPASWRIDGLARVLIGVVLFAAAYMAEVV